MVYDGRKLDKNLIVELSMCQYISQHRSIVLQGPTGSGKTFLGCALGRNACLNRIKTRYIRLPDLLMERRSDSTSTVFCTQYRKEDWVKRLGRSVQAEAIVDRYAYSAYWIEMGTKNMREYCANLPQ